MADAEWTRETDVVVIGGGLAGYCAAIEAAQ
ncbi:MAG: FAD-binding protein, partial [Betaproteobacteria bacterium]|nr:FAD-binding protein [Betaproteobacteria bacterium]